MAARASPQTRPRMWLRANIAMDIHPPVSNIFPCVAENMYNNLLKNKREGRKWLVFGKINIDLSDFAAGFLRRKTKFRLHNE